MDSNTRPPSLVILFFSAMILACAWRLADDLEQHQAKMERQRVNALKKEAAAMGSAKETNLTGSVSATDLLRLSINKAGRNPRPRAHSTDVP